MAGKMCGLCGKYDAECEQEYRMPNGYVTKDAVNFGHSWIVEERPCRGGMQALINFISYYCSCSGNVESVPKI